jgi:hypothetical protein
MDVLKRSYAVYACIGLIIAGCIGRIAIGNIQAADAAMLFLAGAAVGSAITFQSKREKAKYS